MSLPWSTFGIVRTWIGVGDMYPDSLIERTVSEQSSSCSKVNVFSLVFLRFEITGQRSLADTTPVDSGFPEHLSLSIDSENHRDVSCFMLS
jgi:hypothetical protein